MVYVWMALKLNGIIEQLNLAFVSGLLSSAGIGGMNTAPTQDQVASILNKTGKEACFAHLPFSVLSLVAAINSCPFGTR